MQAQVIEKRARSSQIGSRDSPLETRFLEALHGLVLTSGPPRVASFWRKTFVDQRPRSSSDFGSSSFPEPTAHSQGVAPALGARISAGALGRPSLHGRKASGEAVEKGSPLRVP